MVRDSILGRNELEMNFNWFQEVMHLLIWFTNLLHPAFGKAGILERSFLPLSSRLFTTAMISPHSTLQDAISPGAFRHWSVCDNDRRTLAQKKAGYHLRNLLTRFFVLLANRQSHSVLTINARKKKSPRSSTKRKHGVASVTFEWTEVTGPKRFYFDW